MTKTYITAISLQQRGGFLKVCYQPQGFELENNLDTSFPIIPIIAEDAARTDNIKVIALRTDNRDTEDNYQIFLEQLSEIGVKEEQVSQVICEENQSKNVGVKALLQIIDEIPEDSIVFADITFGTKPMAMYILYSALFVEQMKDAEVVGIYYGEINRSNTPPTAKLYELTVLKEVANLIDDMKDIGISDIRGALQNLIEM